MNHRWLGGTLTNWKTVSQSISRLKSIDEKLASGAGGLTKKERLGLEREQAKLQQSLGGIREMGGTPDLIFVIDTNKEDLAILEARKLGIPVIAVLDFELVAGRHRLSDPGQRRRGPGDRALLRPDRARRDRRHGGADGRRRRRHRRAGRGAGRGGRGGRGRRGRGLSPSPPRRGAGQRLRGPCNAIRGEPTDVDQRDDGEGAARGVRRRDDGRQEGADRDRRRHGGGDRLAAGPRASPRRRRRPGAPPPRGWSGSRSGAASASRSR